MARAKAMMMLGDWFSAAEALAMGLVNEVVPPAQLLPRAMEVATRLAGFNPVTMTEMKRIMNRPLREQLDGVLAAEDVAIKAAIKASGAPLGAASKL